MGNSLRLYSKEEGLYQGIGLSTFHYCDNLESQTLQPSVCVDKERLWKRFVETDHTNWLRLESGLKIYMGNNLLGMGIFDLQISSKDSKRPRLLSSSIANKYTSYYSSERKATTIGLSSSSIHAKPCLIKLSKGRRTVTCLESRDP